MKPNKDLSEQRIFAQGYEDNVEYLCKTMQAVNF